MCHGYNLHCSHNDHLEELCNSCGILDFYPMPPKLRESTYHAKTGFPTSIDSSLCDTTKLIVYLYYNEVKMLRQP